MKFISVVLHLREYILPLGTIKWEGEGRHYIHFHSLIHVDIVSYSLTILHYVSEAISACLNYLDLCSNGKLWLLKVSSISPGDGYHKFQVETLILGKVQDLPKGLERENRIIQTILRQLLFALDGLHSTGIVHRDIKPQNVIFSEGTYSKECIMKKSP